VGQEEQIIFGPTTLHGDAIKIKCSQLGYKECDEYITEIEDIILKIIKSSH
jgi:hypothetical protein